MRYLLAPVLTLACAAAAPSLEVGGPALHGEVECDLPVPQRTKNVGGSDGAGLCVFSSIGHSARYQNVDQLKDFQAFMRRFPGGGWPEKVDKMIARKVDEGHLERVDYAQYEGDDLGVLRAALDAGRMPAITYDGRDPHYRSHIEHMTNLVYLDEHYACVLDNNFVGEEELVWMTPEEFLSRWKGGSGRHGWAVFLFAPGCPPVPTATKDEECDTSSGS